MKKIILFAAAILFGAQYLRPIKRTDDLVMQKIETQRLQLTCGTGTHGFPA